MNNIIKIMSVLIVLCTLSACSSHKTDPDDFKNQVDDKFKTDIRTNGIKLFTYKAKLKDNSLALPHQERIQQAKTQNRSPKSQRSFYTPDLSDWTEQIELGLSKTLDMTGYCREGFMELSRMIEVGRGEIRGECNEGATDKDREKFSS